MTRIELAGIAAGYEAGDVFSNLNLSVEPGELLALLGPSGCGKTTLLKLVAGLLPIRAGTIKFDGQVVNDVAPEHREATLVFQKPLLFPHLSVGENVGFAPRLKRAPDRKQTIARMLNLVQLEGFASRRVSSLSGGQEQRVALARALAANPKVLLLDEPFAALDPTLRGEMREMLLRLHRELKITTIFVTHDRHEAVEVADRIALMLDGRIEQTGSSRDFYTAPASLKAARFFGWQIVGGKPYRPESLSLSRGDVENCRVESVRDYGTRVSTTVVLDSREHIIVDHAPPAYAIGERVTLILPSIQCPNVK